MKNFPYPDKKLEDKKQIELHYAELIANALQHLNIDGYVWNILLPGDDGFIEDKDSSAVVSVQYPYKKFNITLQQTLIDSARTEALDSGFWHNTERSMFHECIHVVLWRFAALAEKRYVTQREISEADEEITDHFAIAFYALLRDLRKEKDVNITKAKKRKKTP